MGFSACIPLTVYTWINILYHASCYNQLVRPGYTRASSSSVAYGGYPNKTVDGNFRQSNYKSCMHTAGGHSEAWLRIDLRKIYNINSVKLWYRNDSRNPRLPNTRRIQGYNIRLSNTTQHSNQVVCFQHTGNETLPPIIENKCEGVAQFVWINTSKTFADGAFLEICEVQVFGCTPGRYGKDCKESCGHCESNTTCNDINGSCPGPCEPGYHGEKCLTKCDDGWFGKECKNQCGYCRSNSPCHHVTGSCFGLCEPGFRGEKCQNSVSYQILSNLKEVLKLMRELISYRTRKIELRENGTSPTDFK